MFVGGTCDRGYHASAIGESLSLQRSPANAAPTHTCSPHTFERYPPALPRAGLAQRLVSPLWRHDSHDGFDRGSTREEFGLTWDVCDVSRESGTCDGRSLCER